MNFLIVGIGGMVGAVLRSVVISVGEGIALWLINGLGSFVLGVLNGMLTATNKQHEKLRLFLGTGLLGAFTTFSTFSAEWFELLRASLVSGLLYGFGMTIFCLVFAWMGLNFGRRWGEKR